MSQYRPLRRSGARRGGGHADALGDAEGAASLVRPARWCCTSSTRSPSCRSNASSWSSGTRAERVTKTAARPARHRSAGRVRRTARAARHRRRGERRAHRVRRSRRRRRHPRPSGRRAARARRDNRPARDRASSAGRGRHDPHRDRAPSRTGLGRVVRGKDGRVARVVEHADADADEREINEINTSIYCFRRGLLAPALAAPEPGERAGRVLPDRRDRGAARRRPQRDRARGRGSRRGDHGQRPCAARRGRNRAAARASTACGCARA